ncbi:putative cytochrome b [Anaplasma phagocytophilum str. CR1007]|nr:putative cytochrome b [Anaplasma phagocytophilum str. CR1007]
MVGSLGIRMLLGHPFFLLLFIYTFSEGSIMGHIRNLGSWYGLRG